LLTICKLWIEPGVFISPQVWANRYSGIQDNIHGESYFVPWVSATPADVMNVHVSDMLQVVIVSWSPLTILMRGGIIMLMALKFWGLRASG